MFIFSAVLLALSGLAIAKGGDKGSGKYTIILNGKTYTDDKIKLSNLACQGTITVRGINNGFDIDCATMNLANYAFTGAENPVR
jgi:hypothetical protein